MLRLRKEVEKSHVEPPKEAMGWPHVEGVGAEGRVVLLLLLRSRRSEGRLGGDDISFVLLLVVVVLELRL